MPQQTFQATAPDGRVVEITGDKMPNGSQLRAIFAKLPPAKPKPLDRMGPDYRDPMAGMPRTFSEGVANVKRNVPEMAPTLGAMAATALVPPSALYTIPAAFVGGATGAFARGDAPMDAMTRGAGEGALEAGGRALSTLLRVGGEALYRGMLKPSKAVRQEFPNVSNELLEQRRLIARGGDWLGMLGTRGGADAALDAVEASANAADDLTQAAAGNRRLSVSEVTLPMRDVRTEVRGRIRAGLSPEDEMNRIAERVDQMYRQTSYGRSYTLAEATELKRKAQAAATGAYNQMKRGNIKQLSTDDLIDAATARGFKEAIEARVPGVKEANARTQSLIGQSHALEDAVGRTGNHIPFGSVSDLSAMGAGKLSGSPLVAATVKAGTFAPSASAMAILANEIGKQDLGAALRLGQLVRINGKDKLVTKINKDGTFEAVPVNR